MPARNDQSQRRIPNRRIFKCNRIDVTFDVIDADKGNIQTESQRFGKRHADEQRTDKPRTVCNGNRV
jgi:hypothetical protein